MRKGRLVAALLLGLLVACGAPGPEARGGFEPARARPRPLSPAAAAAVPVASRAEADSRLDVVVEGQVIHLRNGGLVYLTPDLAAEIFLDPYPPTTLQVWLDLYLTREPAGEPVLDAQAAVEYDMRYMYHGFVRAEGRNLGNGHYLFRLDYGMYGAWDQLVSLRLDGRRHELPIVVVAYP